MKPESSDRREFLTGKAALKGVAADSNPAARQPPLLEVSRQAMACEFAVILPDTKGPESTDTALSALDRVEELEDQLSIFRDHSEVSQLNRQASLHPVLTEANLFQLIERAIEIHNATGGAFDITSGPLSKIWGFHHRSGKLPDKSLVADVLERIGSGLLILDRDQASVRFAQPGMEINFGAIGKGYALDECAQQLRSSQNHFILHGGMSSMLARGSRDEADGGWRIAVRNPVLTEQRLLEITLHNQALATSGSAKQFFYFQGRRFSHVIDPRSGWPVEGTWSTTVVTSDAAEADALSTALFVLGPLEAAELCRQRTDISAWIVTPGEKSGSMRLLVSNPLDCPWDLVGSAQVIEM